MRQLTEPGLAPGRKPRPTKLCINCNNRFIVKREDQLYCSVKCRKQARRLRRLSGERSALTDRRCVLCGNRMDESVRSHAKFCSDRCRREAFKQKSCVYCGEVANSRDHFVPQAFVKRMEDLGWIGKHRLIVPACRECNSTAGSEVFRTLAEKRAYIHRAYKKKYAKLLDAPTWSEEEMSELGDSLRTHVRQAHYAQQTIKARLRWPKIL